jgi:CheY-like chemotaxis protein
VLFTTQSTKKGVELYFYKRNDLPFLVLSDELRLDQVLTNLLSNALKFTSEGIILLKIELKEKIDEETALISFSVKDTGIGMSEEQHKRLFLPFMQADSSTTRKFGGTGLGLMISKKIVEAMGGEIVLQSKENEGSTFSFELKMQVHTWQQPSIFNNTSYKILIVDDQEISREILKDMILSFSCLPEEAKNGLEAIAMVKKADDANAPYDFILMDWMMPSLDGSETIRRLNWMHDEGVLKHQIPSIMMVSAHTMDEMNLDGIAIDNFLTKPVTSSTLFDALSNVKNGIIKNTIPHADEELPNLSGISILLVEDNEINQEVASMMLERVGVNVTLANNGEEGVELYLANPSKYNAILMDLQMPIMGGYEATKIIREQDKVVPIIALTAAAMIEDKEKVLEAGMNDHLSKPIDTTELYKKIAQWFHPINVETPKKLEVLDFEFLKKSVRSQERINQLFILLDEQLDDEFRDIIELVETKNSDAGVKIHALKGLSATVGAKALASACANIDAKYKTNEEVPHAFINALKSAIDALKKELISIKIKGQSDD